ncbi:PREDICTED: defensin-like protein 4 [Camelina sativa]|uniref:Defensin-like protein 4 n=1 Tax=Camelina sativa TaxID=90675 RepID=A0ABM0YZR5_CAMSA|nr:PREDICTED: defensin-like protein 4 [Camelina sativa]
MVMATKLVSTLAIFFVLVLVISEMPGTEAHAEECLKEYGGDVGFQFCAPRIFPSFCVSRCQADKGAKGGKCTWGSDGVKCLCDFCGEELTEQFIRQV